MEEWKTIPHCDAYQVSSLGRIKRIAPGKRTKVGAILSIPTSGRYQNVTLVKDGIRKNGSVHRLVCEAFHGPAPSSHHHAAHLNGNSHDNRAINLAWVLRTENEAHKILHGTRVRGERSHFARLTPEAVRQIRKAHRETKLSNSKIAAQFGTTKTAVQFILSGRTWKHIIED